MNDKQLTAEQQALINKARQDHNDVLNEFIALANQCKDRGIKPEQVSAAMMTATAFYTTYVYAGNDGYLQDTGIDKIVDAFADQVALVQEYKKSILNPDG